MILAEIASFSGKAPIFQEASGLSAIEDPIFFCRDSL